MILGLFYTQDSWGSIGNEVSFRVRVAPPPSPTPTLDRCASKNVQSQLLRRLAWVTELKASLENSEGKGKTSLGNTVRPYTLLSCHTELGNFVSTA